MITVLEALKFAQEFHETVREHVIDNISKTITIRSKDGAKHINHSGRLSNAEVNLLKEQGFNVSHHRVNFEDSFMISW